MAKKSSRHCAAFIESLRFLPFPGALKKGIYIGQTVGATHFNTMQVTGPSVHKLCVVPVGNAQPHMREFAKSARIYPLSYTGLLIVFITVVVTHFMHYNNRPPGVNHTGTLVLQRD